MRKLFIILFLITGLIINAQTYYHFANSGDDDTGDGSIGNPYKTIAKANTLSPSAGDSIVFKAGDVWREELEIQTSGTSGNYVHYGKYFTGANPQILGSKATTTWTDQGSNVWKTAITFINPSSISGYAAEIWFNESGTISWGKYKATTGALAAKYDWTWSGNYIYIYSTSDPVGVFTSVEVPQRFSCIDTWHRQYIEFNGIDCHYAAFLGYDDNNSHSDHIAQTGCIIKNCEVSYIGGITTAQAGYGISEVYTNLVIQNCNIHDCGRRGISLDVYGNGFTATNALIENCTFSGGFHTTAVDISVGSGYTGGWDGVIIRNNIVSDVSTAPYTVGSNQIFLQDWNPGSGALLKNVEIYCNIFKTPNAASINLEGVDSVYIYNNVFYEASVLAPYVIQLWIDANNTHIKVKNNIFYSSSTNELYGWSIYCLTAFANIDLDYNLYYRANNSVRVISYGGVLYYMNTIKTTLGSNYGWETHAPTPANPLFISTVDYHLQAESPAIAKGIGVGILKDYDGSLWAATPSVGIYEYNVTPPAPPDPPSVAIGSMLTLTAISATVNYSITSNGGGTLTKCGLCWGTNPNPTTANAKCQRTASVGDFIDTVFGLQPGVMTHVRCWATNESGTTYGADISFTTPTSTTPTFSGNAIMLNGFIILIK